MDLNKLTQKSQEAVQQAQTKALRYGHVEVDGEHLLLALIEQSDGLIPRLLSRMEVPIEALRSALEQELTRRPRTSGPGVEAGKNLRHQPTPTTVPAGGTGGQTPQR